MLAVARSRRVRWLLLLGLSVLFPPAGCGTTTKDYQEYRHITTSGTFSARDKPADETQITDAELSQKGYVNIGAIDISSVKPPDIADIKREAARRGADLIKADISSRSGHQQTKTCLDLLSQSNDMTGGGGNNFAECEKYSVETATVTLSIVKGSLWRHGSR